MPEHESLDVVQVTPWPSILGVSVFVVANMLFLRSAFLLAFVASMEETLLERNDRQIAKLSRTGLWAMGGVYIVITLVYMAHQYLVQGFFAVNLGDFVTRTLFYLLAEPKELGVFFMLLSITPAVIGMFNFIMAAAMLRTAGGVEPASPSQIVGFFGAFLTLVTLLGSAASIWSWADPAR